MKAALASVQAGCPLTRWGRGGAGSGEPDRQGLAFGCVFTCLSDIRAHCRQAPDEMEVVRERVNRVVHVWERFKARRQDEATQEYVSAGSAQHVDIWEQRGGGVFWTTAPSWKCLRPCSQSHKD